MGSARRMHSIDTYVNAAKPTTTYYRSPRLGLRKWDNPDAQYAYVTFSKPFPVGAKIVEAKLRIYTYAMPETGAHELRVDLVTEKMTYSRMTWNNRPNVTTEGRVTLSKSGALPGGQLWEFDVKDLIQEVSDGHPWYGFRITTNDPVQRWMYAQETSSVKADGPSLRLVWSDNPDEPQSLVPNEGVVSTPKPGISFEYIDVAGDVNLSQAQIQTSSTTSFTSPTWDSGVLDNITHPSIDLSKTSYPGATAGQRVYYRVRVADGAGLWSERWSATAWFVYKPELSVTPTSFDPASPKFGDSTPDISWTTSGAQKAYRLTLARNSRPDVFLWDTGKVVSSEQTVAVPSGVLRWDDVDYRLVIRTWDAEARIATTNSLSYSSDTYVVRLDEDLASAPVDYVTVEQVKNEGVGTPFIDVWWDRAVSADAFEVVRQDGDSADAEKVILARVTYAESLTGSRHRFQDRTAPPNTRLRYIVRPITNGRRAGGRGSDYFTYVLEGVWLTTVDEAGTSEQISLVINGADAGTWSMPEDATAHHPLDSRAPVVVRSLHRGYEGSISGIIVEEDRYQPWLTRQQKRDRFYYFKRTPQILRLIAGDLNIPVRVANMNIHPTPDYVQQYACSFDFWQDGEVRWDVAPL